MKHNVPITELAILTPYSAQKEKIKTFIKTNNRELREILVASISESQGETDSAHHHCFHSPFCFRK